MSGALVRGGNVVVRPGRPPQQVARHGVTTFLPTLVSSDGATREAALAVPRRALPGARAPGWHLEGPMLHPDARGAHDLRRLREPSLSLVSCWSPGAGVVLVTLAPDLPGALPVVADLVARGVVVSIGHTRATLADVEAAVSAGASMVTHLFNATPPLHHREPGPVGAALGGSTLVAGVIVDGHHVHALVVAGAWRALGPDRFLAVSDCTAALDLPPGPARLGDQDVVVGADGSVRLASDPTVLAGSGAGLDACLWRLSDVTGRRLWEVLPAVTTVPARVLRRPDLATLAPGAVGGAVIWDGRRPAVMLVGGRTVDLQRRG